MSSCLSPRLCDTRGVHVSFTGIFPPDLWSSFLSSSCNVCHQYSFHYDLFIHLITCQLFLCCLFLGSLCYSSYSSNLFVSDLIRLCYSTRPVCSLSLLIIFSLCMKSSGCAVEHCQSRGWWFSPLYHRFET